MADKRLLTDRYLKALPPAPRGQRDEVWDSRLPGFGIRITDAKDADPARRGKAGKVTFVLRARFPSSPAPTRRTIGVYPAITLEDARRTAGEWRSLIAKGVDPAVVEAEAREKREREAAARIRHSFGSAAEAFITDKLKHERSGAIAERDFRAHFVAIWRERPITEITKFDVLEVINAKKRSGAPQMARALLVLIRRFFNWCLDQHTFGLDRSPCDRLKPNKLIGDVPKRNRRLSDAELFAFWRATGRMKYPVGPVYRMLALTGLRLNEAAGLSWPEVQGDVIIIPPSRMKAKDGKAHEHLVPITAAIQEVIGSLPRIKGGKYLFSLSGGKRPLSMTGPIKADLDGRMLRTLKAMARRRGEDHEHVTLPAWVNHDLRRTIRSGMSALRVPANVAEAVLAHRQGGIAATYDLHEYQAEKAEALELWAERIATIVNPEPAAPAKIIKMRKRRR
ncbi:integrase [Bradyrhizobium sp. JR7.2]|uniref:Integrase family protein n=1 Tax=Bradyrhizobium barranii TaxID=2992140 RepID=A0ABY3QZR9_9BRAD|nr:integrase family protein [Bradyrhizobium japonicum]UFW91540.1 integrase family protein [Bradyrhizobium japonicum]